MDVFALFVIYLTVFVIFLLQMMSHSNAKCLTRSKIQLGSASQQCDFNLMFRVLLNQCFYECSLKLLTLLYKSFFQLMQ